LLEYMRTYADEPRVTLDEVASAPVCVYSSLMIIRPVFQKENELEKHTLHCTGNRAYRKKLPRNDFVFYKSDYSASGRGEDALGDDAIGKLVCFFKIVLKDKSHLLTALRPLQRSDRRIGEMVHLTLKISSKVTVEPISCIIRCAHLIQIPLSYAESQNGSCTYVLNNRVDLETFSNVYSL